MKIVAVDDEPMVLELYPALFSNYGFDIDTFDNAREALQFLKENSVDAVISDIDMPSCNGIEFFKQTKKEKLEIGIVIFITGKWEEEYCYLFKEGLDRVFKKPISHFEVAEYLKRKHEKGLKTSS